MENLLPTLAFLLSNFILLPSLFGFPTRTVRVDGIFEGVIQWLEGTPLAVYFPPIRAYGRR